MYWLKYFFSLSMATLLFWGCSDNHDVTVISEDQDTKVIVKLEVHPPEFSRTEDTKTFFTSEISVELTLPVPREASSANDGGHAHKVLGPANEGQVEETVVNTVIGDVKIEATIEARKHLHHYMNNTWTEMKPDATHNYIKIQLSNNNANGSEHRHGSPIAHANFMVNVKQGNVTISTDTLFAIHGHHGLIYGGNIAIADTGIYALEIIGSGPTASARDEENATRVQGNYTVSFSFQNTGAPDDDIEVGDTTFPDSVKIEVKLEAPKTLWVWQNSALTETPPATNATHFVEVEFIDLLSEAHEELISNAEIHCTIFSEDKSDKTIEFELIPVHSEHGYHYGINVGLPEHSDENEESHDDMTDMTMTDEHSH